MYIKSIKLTNFQCYYGQDNLFEFSEGLNIVLGKINKGKSKLFDAFYWVLFGEIYITGNNWIKTDNNKIGISYVNDKAKFEADPGDTIYASVEMVINSVLNYRKVDFTITRKVQLTFKPESTKELWYEKQSWIMAPSVVEMTYVDDNGDFKIIDNDYDVNVEISRFFPKEIRNYSWFQGEALDKLIDFSTKSTFEQAIKHISYYPYYERLSLFTELATDLISKEKNKKIKDATKEKNEYERLMTELERKQKELCELKLLLAELTKSHKKYSAEVDEITKKLEALHEFPPLEKRKARLESDLRNIKKDIDVLLNEQKEQFQQSWMLRGTDSLIKTAKDRMLEFDSNRHQGDQYSLPDDVPPKIFLEKMKEAKKCLICQTEAHEGSVPYNKIVERIKMQDEFFEIQQQNQDLFSAISQIMPYPDDVTYKLKIIDQQIIKFEETLQELIVKRNNTGEELRDVKLDIDKLISKYGISLSDGVNQSQSLNNKLSFLTDQKRQTEARLHKTQLQIKELEPQIKDTQDRLDEIVLPGEIVIPEKKWFEISSYLKEVVDIVKEKAKLDLILKIEEQANQFYFRITQHNNAVDGKISIDPTSYQISRTESDLYQIESGNTGNETLMKMCIINAMLSMNEKEIGVSYPFVADAPTSNLDSETTIAYLKSIANSFNQSIIITKDIQPQYLTKIKEDSDVKTIYELYTKSDDENSERLKQYSSYNKCKKIK